jgi:hypothetical protein
MKKYVNLFTLNRLDGLIRQQKTGASDELAKCLGMKRSNFFDFIGFLQNEMQAPIQYNNDIKSYVYTYPPKFHLGFLKDLPYPDEPDHLECGMNLRELNVYAGEEDSDIEESDDGLQAYEMEDVFGGSEGDNTKSSSKDDSDAIELSWNMNFNDLFFD